MNISILVLTLNEEANLPACLASVQWSDDIVVLDSHSIDRTCSIAVAFGASVIERPFDNWASHQNWAMVNIPFKHEWVFYLDADERMTDTLKEELLALLSDKQRREVAYYCGRKNYFMGKWIRHAMPPGMIMRFFKPKCVRFQRLVNPVPVIDGEFGYLKNHFVHYNFSKGFTEWFDKHNKYSLFEAMEGKTLLQGGISDLSKLFGKDPSVRRRTLKNISFRLPLRPVLKFIYLYVFALGVLDGRPGLRYCLLQSIYEYMIVLKAIELRRKERGLSL
jgi:glycosyltransferase involved in cell wall biosynthesis